MEMKPRYNHPEIGLEKYQIETALLTTY